MRFILLNKTNTGARYTATHKNNQLALKTGFVVYVEYGNIEDVR